MQKVPPSARTNRAATSGRGRARPQDRADDRRVEDVERRAQLEALERRRLDVGDRAHGRGRRAVGEDRAARRDRDQREAAQHLAHARRGQRPHPRLEQLDLVGGELGGVRPADVAVLVVADQRVDPAGVAQRQHHQLVDHLVGGVAVELAEEVGPVALVEVRAVDQIAGEQQVGVAGRGVDLVEDLDDPVEVAQAALQVGADQEPAVIRQP
jgi:hypothetical protein